MDTKLYFMICFRHGDWIEDRPIELIDDSVGDFALSEMLRCIHVGLLCVQQRPEDRPNTLSVVLMLSSESLLPNRGSQASIQIHLKRILHVAHLFQQMKCPLHRLRQGKISSLEKGKRFLMKFM